MPASKIDKKVLVGLSGGVDSAAAAYLLQQQGYEVAGIYMKNWQQDDTENYCSDEQEAAMAQQVCDVLNIPLHTVNFAKEYWQQVFSQCLEGFKKGITPNPDLLCNREIKFKVLLDYVTQLGFYYLATGHYARILQNSAGVWQLLKGQDSSKDQSYFLYTLQQDQLARSLFPLGDWQKTKVRELAKSIALPNYDKKDSTGICFIGERPFREFLQQYLPLQPGNIVTVTGQIIGRHQGLMYYTLGQRHGLQIGGLRGFSEAPWFVVEKDLTSNLLVVDQNSEHTKLMHGTLYGCELSWTNPTAIPQSLSCYAKIRYRQNDQACHFYRLEGETFKVEFIEPQRAITPGQGVVFYQDEQCLGGGVITESK